MSITQAKKNLPSLLKQELSDYEWHEILIGCSESEVFRLSNSGSETIYLKISTNDSFPSLYEEKNRLDWLNGKLPVPKVLAFETFKDKAYLLTTEVSGINSNEAALSRNKRDFIRQLAAGLSRIHRLPIENCPFDMRLEKKIQLAEERMRKGLIDEEDFDDERSGRTAESLFSELIQTRPVKEDLVFTHGDFCLPNIILEDDEVSGFIDLGSAGIADRYQDIALLARSIEYNFGAESVDILFNTMSIKPDTEKIRFYILLDEFF